MYPIDLLLDYLKTLDEVLLCELLDISSEELVDMFQERIAKRRSYLEKEVELMNEVDGARAEDFVDEDNTDDDWN
jgi:hypothetical protein